MPDFAAARGRMVDLVRSRGISEPRLIEALRSVPRDEFVGEGSKATAYDDTPLAIGEEQTISQPFIVALMLEQAEIGSDDVILDVGTGSGYAAAVASLLAREVFTIERIASLAEDAGQRFQRLGFGNVHVRTGDGTKGWPENSPFDAILVAAATATVPRALKEQLAIGGRLVLPVGDEDAQRLMRITRRGETEFAEEYLGGVVFVPLIGGEDTD